MSDKQPKEINELAQILNRINALVKPDDLQADGPEPPENLAADIPQLTEIYEGELRPFITNSADELPVLSEIVKSPVSDAGAVLGGISGQAEKMEALLAEMAPLVQAAIKKAAEQKLIDAGKPARTKMEAEIMQVLRERLQVMAFNNES